MAQDFDDAEWAQITTQLDGDPAGYGLPERRDGSVVLASWNIRKFGRLTRDDGSPAKSPGATAMIERFAERCDLLAIQEVQTDTASLYALRDALAAGGQDWRILYSDVTGRAPGYEGMSERAAYLYRGDRVQLGNLASDLSFDRRAVMDNSNEALRKVVSAQIEKAGEDGLMAQITAWLTGQTRIAGAKLQRFVQFIRTPHLVEFVIPGPDGAYRFYCVNAHLVSGKSKREREQEFFALLEWLLIDSKKTVTPGGISFLLMADLNLDFQSNVDKRRAAFAEYMTSINREKDLRAKVNFPFLDGAFFTNARGTETFDHIAWISEDTRLPRGRHNETRGTHGADGFDYGMFDFARLIGEAGFTSGGAPDYERFEHDLSDHMPIWVRLPRPVAGQADFSVD
ncbi:hypothetical protein [Pseudaestuariivita atlantica]|uniref:Endonuclease/exonuclease/phosphatase domain-containing protein n=1 Tax=Pseudaestuariivita atlantica TaxID=1317121 RepID=A0A0L1JML2_9RHOB|nr:hypothetical protein [Pseudaestuariivita atlantica]KNG92658.1 hypothetical protein ATO11_16735 [Pseudaestuariivita atlantica]